MKIFPYPLLRICGGAYNNIEEFQDNKIQEVISRTIDVDDSLFRLSMEIQEILIDLIPLQQDKKTKFSLVNIKNRVSKRLPIKEKDILNILNLISIAKDVQFYNELIANHDIQRETLLKCLDENEKNTSFLFRQFILANPNFSSAILISSYDLYNEIDKYLSNKSTKKTELSLFKYFMRYTLKTSPFSEFTHVNFCSLDINNKDLTLLNIGEKKKILTINLVFKSLIFSLMEENENFSSLLELTLNKSLGRIDSSTSIYITNVNNKEEVHLLSHSPILNLIFEIFSEEKKVCIHSLTCLLSDTVDASGEEIRLLIEDLMSKGILILHKFYFDKEENWLTELTIKLGELLPKEIYSRIEDKIKLTSEFLIKYEEESSPLMRFSILKQMVCAYFDFIDGLFESEDSEEIEIFEQIRMKFQRSMDHHVESKFAIERLKSSPMVIKRLLTNVKKNQFVFEDVRSSMSQKMNTDFICEITTCLDEINSIDLDNSTKVNHIPEPLWKAFVQNNSILKDKSLIETYYHYWTSDFKDDEIFETGKLSEENENIVSELVKESLVDDQVNINSKVFKRTEIFDANAYTAFVQLYMENDILKGVLNSGIMDGNGRILSRFLNRRSPHEEKVLNELRLYNSSDNESTILVELNHPSDFNANIHPRLTRYQLSHSDVSDENQLFFKDIMVVYDKATEKLDLFHKKLKKKIRFINVDIQSTNTRPTYYKFLLYFFPSNSKSSISVLVDTILEKRSELGLSTGSPVDFLPRLVLDERIILRRKGWRVRTEILAEFIKKELSIFLVEITRIKRKYEIPDEVFITLVGNENRKPIYLSFNLPLTLNIFQDSIKSYEGEFIYIYEFAPSPKELVKDINDNRFVTEHILEWKN